MKKSYHRATVQKLFMKNKPCSPFYQKEVFFSLSELEVTLKLIWYNYFIYMVKFIPLELPPQVHWLLRAGHSQCQILVPRSVRCGQSGLPHPVHFSLNPLQFFSISHKLWQPDLLQLSSDPMFRASSPFSGHKTFISMVWFYVSIFGDWPLLTHIVHVINKTCSVLFHTGCW